MPDAKIESAQQTKDGKNDQRDPQDAPMNRKLTRNRHDVPLVEPVLPQRKRERQHEQSEKGQRRFQHEQNRKVEPNTVPVTVTQNERRPASGNQYHCYSSQIQPRRHEQPTQRHRGCTMANTVKYIGSLMEGEDEVNHVDRQRSPQNALERGAPARLPPGTGLTFVNRLARHSTPARAQNKCDKDEEQNPRREFRKKCARQAQSK